MSNEAIGGGCVAILMLLLFLRVPIGVALTVISVGGIAVLTSWKVASSLLQTVPYTFVATWTMSSIPMFLFMDYLCYHAGITTGMSGSPASSCGACRAGWPLPRSSAAPASPP